MSSATDAQAGKGAPEVATTVTPEVKAAAAQAVLSEGDIAVSGVLRDRREETLALAQRLLASAGIQGTFSIPETEGPNEVAVALAEARSDTELSPEEKWFGEFKARFDALPKLHKGIQWADVEKSLRAEPESMKKLQALDEKGHKINVFGEEDGEFIFVSAWDNYEHVSTDHRSIAYDPEGQRLAEKNGYSPNGNAVSLIAKIMSVKEDVAIYYLADPKFHEQLRAAIAVNGWAWLKTDAAKRKTGNACTGASNGIRKYDANAYHDNGSFRVALRVKKA